MKTHRPTIDIRTKHPALPIRIGLALPHEQKDQWAKHLAAIFDNLSASVVTIDTGAQCTEPPVASKFHVNRFSEELIGQVRNWRRARAE